MADLTLRLPPDDLPVTATLTMTDASGNALAPNTAYGTYEMAFTRGGAVVTDGTDTLLATGTADADEVVFAFTAD